MRDDRTYEVKTLCHVNGCGIDIERHGINPEQVVRTIRETIQGIERIVWNSDRAEMIYTNVLEKCRQSEEFNKKYTFKVELFKMQLDDNKYPFFMDEAIKEAYDEILPF